MCFLKQDKTFLKSIWGNIGDGILTLPAFKTYHKASIIKPVWFGTEIDEQISKTKQKNPCIQLNILCR